MKIKVLVFGVLKAWLGATETTVELSGGSNVSALLEKLSEGRSPQTLRGIAVSINAEFASASSVLKDGDEVGLLPPVSGGHNGAPDRVALVRERIDADSIANQAKAPEDGAVVLFDGIVRNQTHGRQTLYLEYEAYEQMALRQLEKLAREAREQFGVRHVSIVHRVGRLEIGESSVLIAVASAHRGAAFDACRWIIDTLKKTVPIWKKEIFADGAVWRDGEPFPEDLAIAPEQPGDSR